MNAKIFSFHSESWLLIKIENELEKEKKKSPNSFNLDYRKKTKDSSKNLKPIPRKEGRTRIETELPLE